MVSRLVFEDGQIPMADVDPPNQITGLDRLLGFVLQEASADRVVLTWTITPDHWQPFGITHGGVYCAAVESAASVGATRTSRLKPLLNW